MRVTVCKRNPLNSASPRRQQGRETQGQEGPAKQVQSPALPRRAHLTLQRESLDVPAFAKKRRPESRFSCLWDSISFLSFIPLNQPSSAKGTSARGGAGLLARYWVLGLSLTMPGACACVVEGELAARCRAQPQPHRCRRWLFLGGLRASCPRRAIFPSRRPLAPQDHPARFLRQSAQTGGLRVSGASSVYN